MTKRKLVKSKVGRKPLYDEWLTESGLAQITEWTEKGLNGKQIAYNMGIAQSTLYEWFSQFPELMEAIKLGKRVIDIQVENSMYRLTQGYQYEEDVYEPDENGELVVVKRTLKSQAPNVAAQIFWLKNRQPELWRDKVEIQNEHTGTIKVEMGEMDKWSN